MRRRDWLKRSAVMGAGLAWSRGESAVAGAGEEAAWRIVDTNVSLFDWPFRKLPLDTPGKLLAKLRSLGVVSAWAGSFEGITHRDLTGVNARLAEACGAQAELVPIGSINPALPGWREDLQKCASLWRMPGVRVHPGYHGYSLGESPFRELLRLATEAGLFVQIVAALEDTRTQPELMRVADVDLTPLAQVLPEIPQARVQILNARPRGAWLKQLASLPGLYWDVSRLDGTAGVPELVQQVPAGRVLFGSHAPFLIPEAALIRVHEADRLSRDELRAVYADNAEQFLRGAV